MTQLSASQIGAAWLAAGGSADSEAVAVAVALAESSGYSDVISATSDYGLWQINAAHRAFFGSLFDSWSDPVSNARMAVSVSQDGTNWAPWSTAYANIAATGFVAYLAAPEQGSPAANWLPTVRAVLGTTGAAGTVTPTGQPNLAVAVSLPPGPYPSVDLPPTAGGLLNIPQGALTPGAFMVVRTRYTAIVPKPQPGFYSFWSWTGNGWQEWNGGEQLIAGSIVGLLPPDVSLPGGLTARPTGAAPAETQPQTPAVTSSGGFGRGFPTAAIAPAGTGPTDTGGGGLPLEIPGLPGPPGGFETTPTDLESAWANWQDWNNAQVPAKIALFNSILSDMEGIVS